MTMELNVPALLMLAGDIPEQPPPGVFRAALSEGRASQPEKLEEWLESYRGPAEQTYAQFIAELAAGPRSDPEEVLRTQLELARETKRFERSGEFLDGISAAIELPERRRTLRNLLRRPEHRRLERGGRPTERLHSESVLDDGCNDDEISDEGVARIKLAITQRVTSNNVRAISGPSNWRNLSTFWKKSHVRWIVKDVPFEGWLYDLADFDETVVLAGEEVGPIRLHLMRRRRNEDFIIDYDLRDTEHLDVDKGIFAVRQLRDNDTTRSVQMIKNIGLVDSRPLLPRQAVQAVCGAWVEELKAMLSQNGTRPRGLINGT